MTTPTIESMRRLERLCTRFEAAHDPQREAIEPLIDPLLAEVEPRERSELLRELLAIDVELRQQRGIVVTAADYRSILDRDDVSISASDLRRILEGADLATNVPTSSRYRFIKKVGSGGNGDVWRVEDSVSQRTLAVKRLRDTHRDDASAKARLNREALLTGRLQHPGIPPIYDHGELDDGASFFSMKLVEGETFESILKARSPDDDVSRYLGIFEQIAQTVAYAHTQGVIHRDLKPQNVMVGAFGEVQVMDWGMAKAPSDTERPGDESASAEPSPRPVSLEDTTPANADESHDELARSLTMAGDILGTPAYMSPEQARGQGKTLDARSDVFTLGAILFEILTHSRLHEGCRVGEALRRAATGDLNEPLARLAKADVPEELSRLCANCLAVDPDSRPSDATAVTETITGYLTAAEQRARQAEIDQRAAVVFAAGERKRRRLQTRTAVIIALVSVIGASIAFWQRRIAINANTKTAVALELADKRFAQAQSVVDELLSKVADDRGVLVKTPGAQALRHDLLLKAVRSYETFLAESEQDPELRFKVAQAYYRLGNSVFLLAPGGKQLVRYAERTIELCDGLIAEFPDQSDYVDYKARAYELMFKGAMEAERYDLAMQNGRANRQWTQRLVDIRGSSQDRFRLAESIGRLGATQHWRKRHDESGTLLRQAIEMAQPIHASNPNDVGYTMGLSRIHSNMGVHYGWGRGKWPQCLEEFEKAVELCAQAAAMEPERADYRSELAGRQMNLAMGLTHAKRLDEADQAFRSAISNHDKIVLENPLAIDHRDSLARACANFSTFCMVRVNRPEEAIRFNGKAIVQYRQLMETNPGIEYYVKVYTSAVINDATLRVNAGEHQDHAAMISVAGPLIDLALAAWEAWCDDHPDSTSQRSSRAFWMAMRSTKDPAALLELTRHVDEIARDGKTPDSFDVDARAMALIRCERHDDAIDLLESNDSRKLSTRRRLIECLAWAGVNPNEARSRFKTVRADFNPDRAQNLDTPLLFREVESTVDSQ